MLMGPLAIFGILWGLDWSGTISISWWLITMPLWISVAVVIAVTTAAGGLGSIGIAGASLMHFIWHRKYVGRHRKGGAQLEDLSDWATKLMDEKQFPEF